MIRERKRRKGEFLGWEKRINIAALALYLVSSQLIISNTSSFVLGRRQWGERRIAEKTRR